MRRPHTPLILSGFSGRSCAFAMRIDTGSKSSM